MDHAQLARHPEDLALLLLFLLLLLLLLAIELHIPRHPEDDNSIYERADTHRDCSNKHALVGMCKELRHGVAVEYDPAQHQGSKEEKEDEG